MVAATTQTTSTSPVHGPLAAIGLNRPLWLSTVCSAALPGSAALRQLPAVIATTRLSCTTVPAASCLSCPTQLSSTTARHYGSCQLSLSLFFCSKQRHKPAPLPLPPLPTLSAALLPARFSRRSTSSLLNPSKYGSSSEPFQRSCLLGTMSPRTHVPTE